GDHTVQVTVSGQCAGTPGTVTNSVVLTVTCNQAPRVCCSAVAGAIADRNCQAAVPNVLGGVTVSDDCSAGGAITLSQWPVAGTLVGVGAHAITVTATDGAGNSATCTTTFTVTDNTAPSVICSAVPGASADDNCQAAVPN